METSRLIEEARRCGAPARDGFHETVYRCAVHLTDGLYLPCVVVADSGSLTELAIRRFQETIEDNEYGPLPFGRPIARNWTYSDAVRSFVTKGNTLEPHDIDRVEPSPFAIPLERLANIPGETRMSWTAFTGAMKDGARVSFATSYSFYFFHMPDGYSGHDVVGIEAPTAAGDVYRERLFFTCYVEGLK